MSFSQTGKIAYTTYMRLSQTEKEVSALTIALNPVKHEQSRKRSVKGKRLDAGWNNDYLLKILIN
jgi:hypothetical protein